MSTPTGVSQLSEASLRLCEALAVLNMTLGRAGNDAADGLSAATTLVQMAKDIVDSEDCKP